ncbi:putative pectinesterase/pectinesterase inhibitor 24 [Phtheirospermum japonicum]|uniref:Pectinesterase n=1 Tax=Phtheirospermum japonicum TaxID=374723 RepID=A0A830C4K8_9LAMI|nr:putative pectinesterase/pectinesterase inhibitor 24 [Phtheirospermum japonicum]
MTYDSEFFYNLSVQVSIDEISKASKNFNSENGILTQTIKHTHDKLTLSALQSCRVFLSLALYNLNWSLPTSRSALTTHETRTNFRTWLSAAGADLQTCKNGFEYAPNEVQKLVIANFDNSTKLVTISLGIISKIDDYTSSHEKRSVVDIIDTSSEYQNDWEPNWLSFEDRKDTKLLHNSKQMMTPNAVVATDGSGNYTTITEAINAVPENIDQRFVIYVKNGVYHENVIIDVNKWNILMYGDGMNNTIVSSNLSNSSGTPTSLSATFAVYGIGFIARDIGFQNSAGVDKGQAVALLTNSDQSVFYRCLIDGYQDTLKVQSNRQFYRECKIYGTIDFIFGDGAAVIQNCDILVRRPLPGQFSVITAQEKSDPDTKTGISIQNCTIMAAENLDGVQTYLGRPFGLYSTVVVMESELGDLIDPKGWVPFDKNVTAPDTIFYVEYNNVGPGAATENRVRWNGLRVDDTEDDASMFTVRSFINGDQWIPATGVPFQPDL